jgi:uncharacterized protein YgbK (DUF1537 family)
MLMKESEITIAEATDPIVRKAEKVLEIAILADDITGAADTGVQFLPAYAPIYLIDHRSISIGVSGGLPQGISVFTNSRGLAAREAILAVSAASQAIRALNPRRVYKKIDSALRGHIGAELETAMDVLGLTYSFIAPAFPGQGRTTLAGIHRINDVPVAETEIGRDPVTPVTESFLPTWISRKARWPVAHVNLGTIDTDLNLVSEEIARLRSGGARHISFDATRTRHLDRIARLAIDYFPNTLLCGSAGLAASVVRQLPKRIRSEAERPETGIPIGADGFLFVCGSASQNLRLQVAELAKHADVSTETIDSAWLAGDGNAQAKQAIMNRMASALAEKDLVLQVTRPGMGSPAVDPQRLMAALSELAGMLVKLVEPAGLFLSGGDTAIAVLERLHARAVRLERDLPGGLVYGTIMGGVMSGRPIITKAGSFGKPDALLRLWRALVRS